MVNVSLNLNKSVEENAGIYFDKAKKAKKKKENAENCINGTKRDTWSFFIPLNPNITDKTLNKVVIKMKNPNDKLIGSLK